MARIFVSYSRTDRQFVDSFVPRLRKVYGHASVWFDDDIRGGKDWWKTILDEIGQCELFVYLISNDSLASPYCRDEFREARRLQKNILPVIVRPKTSYPGAVPGDLRKVLKSIQYVDMSSGFRDPDVADRLYASVNSLLSAVPVQPPPPLVSAPVPMPSVSDHKPRRPKRIWVGIVAGIAVVLVLIALVLEGGFNGDGDHKNGSPTETSVTQQGTTPTPRPSNAPQNGEPQTDRALTETMTAFAPTLTALAIENRRFPTLAPTTAAPTPTTSLPEPTAAPPTVDRMPTLTPSPLYISLTETKRANETATAARSPGS